jgi:dienelactone hydrolase
MRLSQPRPRGRARILEGRLSDILIGMRMFVLHLALAGLCLMLVGGCHVSPHPPGIPGTQGVRIEEQVVSLPTGEVALDLYWPAAPQPAPLVMVAHGFLRTKANMAGWGQKLAQEGFVAAVPTLPTLSDHVRNGHALEELIDWLDGVPAYAGRIDSRRVGLMGFSAGGLSSLLAAANHPAVCIWVGLDPVDRDGLGVAAIPRLQAQAMILRAEPSAWNAQGNARDLEKALGERNRSVLIRGAIHIDAEWPTDFWAELACGASNEDKRAAFVDNALAALRAALMPTPASSVTRP